MCSLRERYPLYVSFAIVCEEKLCLLERHGRPHGVNEGGEDEGT